MLEITVALAEGVDMEFVWIEGGWFTMGTGAAEEGALRARGLWSDLAAVEQPARSVKVAGFYLGKYEITQAQWQAVTGAQPWRDRAHVRLNADHPATFISWRDAQQFAYHLNVVAGEELFRLPTEAEWEYACRAGSQTPWFFGEDESQLGQYAWFKRTAWDAERVFAQRVGGKKSNPWGLYDMYGNVWEWCLDWAAFPDPQGGYKPVLRGGSFFNDAANVRSALRIRNDADFRYADIGARLVKIR